jgi:hypothetical protein
MESCLYICRNNVLSSLSETLIANGFRTKVMFSPDNRIRSIIVRRWLNAVRLDRYDCPNDLSATPSEDEKVIIWIPLDIPRFVWLRFSNLGLAADVEKLMLSMPGGNVRRSDTGLIQDWLAPVL